MPINESSGPVMKERWPTEFDIEGVPRDNDLRQQLVEEKMALGNKFAGERVVPRDLSAPVHVPYIFREYPKCLYHPTKKTDASIVARKKAETHNQLHPATPMFVPELLPVTLIVNDKEEERKAFGSGFIDKPPNPEGWTAEDQSADMMANVVQKAVPAAVGAAQTRARQEPKYEVVDSYVEPETESEPEFKFTTKRRKK